MNSSELINEYLKNLDKQLVKANEILESLSDDEFNTKPSEERWSVAEIFSHLNTTIESYFERIEKKITEAESEKAYDNEELKRRKIVEKIILSLEPPYKMKYRAPAQFLSKKNYNQEEVKQRFNQNMNRFKKLLERSKNINLYKSKISSPVTSLIKINLRETYLLIIVHQERHLWQAENTISDFK